MTARDAENTPAGTERGYTVKSAFTRRRRRDHRYIALGYFGAGVLVGASLAGLVILALHFGGIL